MFFFFFIILNKSVELNYSLDPPAMPTAQFLPDTPRLNSSLPTALVLGCPVSAPFVSCVVAGEQVPFIYPDICLCSSPYATTHKYLTSAGVNA